jgi:hypothetical protein
MDFAPLAQAFFQAELQNNSPANQVIIDGMAASSRQKKADAVDRETTSMLNLEQAYHKNKKRKGPKSFRKNYERKHRMLADIK